MAFSTTAPGPRDNRPPSGLPRVKPGIFIRPKHECAWCAQPVVVVDGQPKHAVDGALTCGSVPEPIKAWDA